MKTFVFLCLAIERVLGTYISAPCLDKISNCHEYDADLCTNHLYRLFRDDNCQLFCGLCADYTTEVTCEESTTTIRHTSTDKMRTRSTIILPETTVGATRRKSTLSSGGMSTNKLTTKTTTSIIPLETTDAEVTKNKIESTTIILICVFGTILIFGVAVLGWWFLCRPATKRSRQNIQPI